MPALAFKMDDDPEVVVEATIDEVKSVLGENPTPEQRLKFLAEKRTEVLQMNAMASAQEEEVYRSLEVALQGKTKAVAYDAVQRIRAFLENIAVKAEASKQEFAREIDRFRDINRGADAEVYAVALEIRLQLFEWAVERRAEQARRAYRLARRLRPMGKGPVRSHFAQPDNEYLAEIKARLKDPPAESLEWARGVAERYGSR